MSRGYKSWQQIRIIPENRFLEMISRNFKFGAVECICVVLMGEKKERRDHPNEKLSNLISDFAIVMMALGSLF